MKIAIINNGLSAGGLRFEASLIRGLFDVRPSWKISYFTDLEEFTEETIKHELLGSGVEIADYKILDVELNKPNLPIEIDRKNITKLSSFDALIFTWPYDFCCPDIDIPILFIPHDFNFFYFFESITFPPEYSASIYNNLSDFFARATPVVSTDFIKNEVANFFSEYSDKVNVIPVAAMSNLPEVLPEKQVEILEKFSLKPYYFLYPCSSVKPYKNLGILAVAINCLQQQGVDAQIVYIGNETGKICGQATANGVRQNYSNDFADIKNCNVRGLGFITDEELVVLMKASQAVVTSSLYEAANGPAIDAWSCGVVVAMSDLPFYTEHIKTSGVRATLFDPKNVSSVVDAFKYIIDNTEKVRADAIYSQEQLKKNTSITNFSSQYAELIEGLVNE